MTLDYTAIGRVLAAVEGAGVQVPLIYNVNGSSDPKATQEARDARSALSHSIAFAQILAGAHRDLTSDRRRSDREKALENVLRLCEQLQQKVLNPKLGLKSRLNERLPFGRGDPGIAEIMSSIEALGFAALLALNDEKCAESRARQALADEPQLSIFGGTASDLAITALGNAYRKAFGWEPAIETNKDREPDGPFVAFVQAVRRELDDGVQPDSVRTAWDRAERVRAAWHYSKDRN